MNDSGIFLGKFLIACAFGGVCASIANSKGRNVPGWFFIGFFIPVVGLIILLCLSDLKAEERKRRAMESQHQRLREQLRQEKLKNEALRQHAVARLDLHDETLGMDTRGSAPPLHPTGLDIPRRRVIDAIPVSPPPGLPHKRRNGPPATDPAPRSEV